MKLITSSNSKLGNQLRFGSYGGSREEKDGFRNDDIAIEVLSRLPIEFINKFKCVCKKWYELISHPSFRKGTKDGFTNDDIAIEVLPIESTIKFKCVCKKWCEVLSHPSFRTSHFQSAKVLDFLPEKVVVMASCSGLLLCRNIFVVDHSSESMRTKSKPEPMEVVLYVCNPLTKEWTSLKAGDKYENGWCYGFVHNPFY
ncbi:hypothetical protein AQUCO_03000345v1, partial [Aquilegia coerulea]